MITATSIAAALAAPVPTTAVVVPDVVGSTGFRLVVAFAVPVLTGWAVVAAGRRDIERDRPTRRPTTATPRVSR